MADPFARTSVEVDGIVEVREVRYHTFVDTEAWTTRIPLVMSGLSDKPMFNFPILIQLNEGNFDFTLAQSDGSDLRFAATDSPAGDDWLAMQIERYDSVAKTAQVWILVPEITPLGDTTIYLYCGNATAQAAPTNVFDAYELTYHGDEGEGTLIPLTANPVNGRSIYSGRHFTIFPRADIRNHFSAIDATGLTLNGGTLLIEIKVTDNNQLLDSIPSELENTATEHSHDGYDWIGGIGISSTTKPEGGPIKEIWKEGLRDLGIQRQWHEHEISMADWIYRSATSLPGNASTSEDDDGNPNGNGSGEIVGSGGTNWNSTLSEDDCVMMVFEDADNEQIMRVSDVDSNTSITVWGYPDRYEDREPPESYNVGVNFSGRTLRKCTNASDFEPDQVRHVRVVGHFKSHNVQLFFRNVRVKFAAVDTNIVLDSTGKNDAQRTVLTNGEVTTAGIVGSAFAFNLGEQGRFRISKYLEIGGRNFTLSAWFKANANCDSFTLLGAVDMRMRFETSLNVFLQFGKFRRDTDLITDIFDQQWHHVAVVRNRANNFFKVYIDGDLEINLTESAEDFGVEDFVYVAGDDNADTTEEISGILDEVRLIFEAKDDDWIANEFRTVDSSLVTFGDAYTAEAIPDGVALDINGGGTLYVT